MGGFKENNNLKPRLTSCKKVEVDNSQFYHILADFWQVNKKTTYKKYVSG